MRYSVQTRERIFEKAYGFLSFAKNMCENTGRNISKNVNGIFSQKLFDRAKRSTKCALKTSSERFIQKTAEATGDQIGNKIADRITKIHGRITQKQLKMSTIKKYLKEDVYLQKKEKKLLRN